MWTLVRTAWRDRHRQRVFAPRVTGVVVIVAVTGAARMSGVRRDGDEGVGTLCGAGTLVEGVPGGVAVVEVVGVARLSDMGMKGRAGMGTARGARTLEEGRPVGSLLRTPPI